jgi:hypothetical protein
MASKVLNKAGFVGSPTHGSVLLGLHEMLVHKGEVHRGLSERPAMQDEIVNASIITLRSMQQP